MSSAEGQSQPEYPMIDKPFGLFLLEDVSNFNKRKASEEDFQGKHLILFFWSKYCAACIESLPRTTDLQKEFADQLTILIVADEEADGSSRSLYLRAKKKLRLTMPYVFDSVFFRKNVPGPTPHLLWIDKAGVVRAITASEELKRPNVVRFLNGSPFNFIDRSYHDAEESSPPFRHYNKPFFTNGNIGEDTEFLFRSLLSCAKPDMPFIGLPGSIDGLFRISTNPKGLVQGCANLKTLYRFAYTGYSNWSYGDSLYSIMDPLPRLVIEDTALFNSDYTTKKGYYCYSLSMPAERATIQQTLTAMQRDLLNYFGYRVTIEKRLRPVWKLYVDPQMKEKLRSKRSDASADTFDWLHVRLTDISMKTFIEQIFAKQLFNKQPIFDLTGIDYNIDIDLRANLLDMEDIRRALNKLGFSLEADTAELNVITISEPTN